MEKIIYALWRDAHEPREAFNARLKDEIAPELAPLTKGLRLNIQDATVAGGTSPLAVSTQPQMEAVVQLWLDEARDQVRAPVDALLAKASSRMEAWLACEATPIPNTKHPPKPGARTEGFSQVVFLSIPPRISYEAWRHHWQGHHTRIAIETQSNFEYRQNLIVRPLTYGAPGYAAMIEECFPIEALNDTAVYYDAVGDPAKLEANAAAMMDSVGVFIDFERMDCIPTSQFEIKPLP